MIRLFVYGTLRKGDVRSFMLDEIDECKFIKNISTKPLYTLVDVGMFPALILGGQSEVHGELWEIGERTKKALDTIEGVPMLYLDEEIELSDGTSAIAYVFKFNRGYPIIESGDWLNR